MEDLLIPAEDKLPKVFFSGQTGNLSLEGRCIPENPEHFYRPLFEWMDEYSASPQNETVIDVNLEYFNTSSSKLLLDLFKKAELISKEGKTSIKVIWRYEADDTDILEAGQIYSSIVDIPFEMVGT